MTCNVDAPKPKNRKYFFGWHLVNGIAFSFKWVEDAGIVVGGIPNLAMAPMEITEDEFLETNNLNELAKQHPYSGVQAVSSPSLYPEDESG